MHYTVILRGQHALPPAQRQRGLITGSKVTLTCCVYRIPPSGSPFGGRRCRCPWTKTLRRREHTKSGAGEEFMLAALQGTGSRKGSVFFRDTSSTVCRPEPQSGVGSAKYPRMHKPIESIGNYIEILWSSFSHQFIIDHIHSLCLRK